MYSFDFDFFDFNVFYFFLILSLNILFYFCIKYGFHSFYCYFFFIICLIFFQFCTLIFYFVSNFGPHFFITHFLIILFILFFNLILNYFLSIIFCTRFSPYCFFLFFFYDWEFCFIIFLCLSSTNDLIHKFWRLSRFKFDIFVKYFWKIDFFNHFHRLTLSYLTLSFVTCSVFFGVILILYFKLRVSRVD